MFGNLGPPNSRYKRVPTRQQMSTVDIRIDVSPIQHAQCCPSETPAMVYNAISVHASLSSPQPRPKGQEIVQARTLLERSVQPVAFIAKCTIWSWAMYDFFVTLSILAPLNAPIRPDFNGELSTTLQSLHFAGTLMVTLGALLRIWCYQTLGRFFTFELAIHNKHALVTTGPYAWVRHPSYTGGFLTLYSAAMVLWATGEIVTKSGGSVGWIGTLISNAWFLICGFFTMLMVTRFTTEEKALEETFKREWYQYKTRVPYTIVPGVV